MNTSTQPPIEQEEINLDHPNGWKRFFQYATEAFTELRTLHSAIDKKPATELTFSNAQTTYQKLQLLVDANSRRLEQGGVITGEDAATAQKFYDVILDARDALEIAHNEMRTKTQTQGLSAVPQRDREAQELEEKRKSIGLAKPSSSAGAMDIAADSTEEKSVPISVVKKIEKPIIERQVVQQPRPKPELAALQVDHKKQATLFIPAKLLQNPHLRDILEEHNITWQQVDRNLKKTIIEVEKPSQLDVFLRVKQGSVYRDLLQGMTIEQLSKFERRSLEQISADLHKLQKENKQQYEYRIYRAWLNLFDDMRLVVPIHKETTFGELCALFELTKLFPEEIVAT